MAGKEGAGEAEELALAEGEVVAAKGDGGGEGQEGSFVGFWRICGVAVNMDLGEDGEDVLVCVFVEGVEIGANGSGEKDGVLGDDGEATAEIGEFDGGDVDSVDQDSAGAGGEEAEKGEGKG